MEAAPDNVTKTSKCTTPAHLFAKSRGRVEEMSEMGVEKRGVGGRASEAPPPPIYRHLPNDFRPWQNRLIKSFFPGEGKRERLPPSRYRLSSEKNCVSQEFSSLILRGLRPSPGPFPNRFAKPAAIYSPKIIFMK